MSPAATPTGSQDSEPASFNPAAIRDFTPGFDLNASVSRSLTGQTWAVSDDCKAAGNGTAQEGFGQYDPFTMSSVGQSLPVTPFNPYADESSTMAGAGAAFFPSQSAFATPGQPLQHHLYANVGPRREDLLPYQRTTSDFFMPEDLRQEMVKKSEAALQVMPNSQLPRLDSYHSLVPLDTSNRKNPTVFGYSTWVYKAMSSKHGRIYCLRRLEGYRLTNEHAIRSVKEWRRVVSANVVRIHDAFTTRAFGDSSLIFVQDYHPLSRTLAEVHLTPDPAARFQQKSLIPEKVLWSYISQIATALKAIHSAHLAARCLDVTKIILTEKNRIRLNGCSILDVVQFEPRRPVQELQQEDLISFGRLMLGLATLTHPAELVDMNLLVDQTGKTYSVVLRDTIAWLLTPQSAAKPKTIDVFVQGVATHIVTSLEESQQREDELASHLSREVENGRIARLMMKLMAINERYEFNGEQAWSENGDKYILKLFRDYVFHQVDRDGNPVLDIGHMIRCLNKMDVGIEEKVNLTSRDGQTTFIISYRELKKMLISAFGELQTGKTVKPGKNY